MYLWQTTMENKKNNRHTDGQRERERDPKNHPYHQRATPCPPKETHIKWYDDTNITLIFTVDLGGCLAQSCV